MKYPSLYLVLLLVLSLSGCITQHAYFQSPFHAATSSYKAIPLGADSLKSAVYAGGVLTFGGANQRLRDEVVAFTGTVHRSHHFGFVQGYYGVTGVLGKYHADNFIPQNTRSAAFNQNLNDSLINGMVGNKLYGGWGLNGGINAVIPFRRRHEWRVFGVEASWMNEFGDYLSFREKLPDTAANINDRRSRYLTLAFSTDVVWRVGQGSIGLKSGYTTATRTLPEYNISRNSRRYLAGFWSETLHFESQKVTGFFQFNVGGHAFNMQAGFNYRLGR
jgi:hypothetical protein